ncbi:MAG TPA: MmoB/DmpM family protein, partial [Polyangiales bacterium]|nr:MmoB/DmpM family protein [Polyangiales bacterium]
SNDFVVLRDRGSYVRVLVPKRCVMLREMVEECLGRPFHLPGDLELIMPAFKGRLRMDDREAVWSVGEDERARDAGAGEVAS